MSAKSDILNSTMEGASRSSPILNEGARCYIPSNSKNHKKQLENPTAFCVLSYA